MSATSIATATQSAKGTASATTSGPVQVTANAASSNGVKSMGMLIVAAVVWLLSLASGLQYLYVLIHEYESYAAYRNSR